MVIKTSIALLGLGLLATPMAMAEPTTGATAGGQTNVPAANDGVKQAPSTIQTGRSESLSKKLDQSGGVIKPQGDMDPGIRAQAPVANPGSTPVVPPSATGGDSAK